MMLVLALDGQTIKLVNSDTHHANSTIVRPECFEVPTYCNEIAKMILSEKVKDGDTIKAEQLSKYI